MSVRRTVRDQYRRVVFAVYASDCECRHRLAAFLDHVTGCEWPWACNRHERIHRAQGIVWAGTP